MNDAAQARINRYYYPGWVIQRVSVEGPMWWSGWTVESSGSWGELDDAERFPRRVDAEQTYRDNFGSLHGVKAVRLTDALKEAEA